MIVVIDEQIFILDKNQKKNIIGITEQIDICILYIDDVFYACK